MGHQPSSQADVSSQSAESSTDSDAPVLDFEFFRTKVQPIFLAERPGHAQCVSCHASDERLRPHLVLLPKGSTMWNEEDSRKNFEEFSRVVIPGSLKSKLLVHPLAEKAGGDSFHQGGKHFNSQQDPEWLILKAWVFGAKSVVPGRAGRIEAANKPRILQTNLAGDNLSIIDPGTNKVVGNIPGIQVSHGVAVAPDGTQIYVSAESDSTLDIVDSKTLNVINRIPLSGHPQNVRVSHDGRKVYVGIMGAKGGMDVIDTASQRNVKTIYKY
jgi:YVTN family beta-propeller protein